MEDKKLIQLIEKNPDKGIQKAMQLYGRAVDTICSSVLQGYEQGLVEEAVSDTFFKLWKNSRQFSPEKGTSLKSWLYSIARNTAVDIRRKHGGVFVFLDDEMETEPISDISIEKEIQEREAKRLLHEVIELLGEPDHQVFLCKYFLFMKNKEIAARLQISEKKTENILYRGKAKLKGLLIERGMTGYEER